MKVGVPKEVKNHEYRVAITPVGVHELTAHGHEVFVQARRGRGLVDHRRGVRRRGRQDPRRRRRRGAVADLVLKVKEPIAEEYHRMRDGQTLFTYLHLAADRPLHRGAAASKASPASPTRPCRLPTAACRCCPRCRRSPAAWRRRCGAYHADEAQGGGRGVLMGGVSGVYARQGRRHRRRRLRA